MHHAVRSWLKNCRKRSSTSFLESAIGGAHKWAAGHVLVITTGNHGQIAINSIVSIKRAHAVIATKAVTREMSKLKLILVFPCDYAHKVPWNLWPLRALSVINCFHSLWPIAYLFTSKEYEESHLCFLHSTTECFCH